MTYHSNKNADDRLVALLADQYAPPTDPAYWAGLESRITARIRQNVQPEWWQVLGGWMSVGAVAAGVAAAMAGVALLQTRAADTRVVYRAVVESTPPLPLTTLTRTARADQSDEREATLRYVITH